jgi:hypothetical protein
VSDVPCGSRRQLCMWLSEYLLPCCNAQVNGASFRCLLIPFPMQSAAGCGTNARSFIPCTDLRLFESRRCVFLCFC